jgi:hypothetical protein
MRHHDTIATAPVPPVPARSQIGEGLRALAAYLDEHPGVPVTVYGCQITEFTQAGDDAAGIAQVDRVAAILGVPATYQTAGGGHYQASRMFGPLRYRITHISAAARASHDAWASYYGSVTTDEALDTRAAAPTAA